jgi:hypothetical protein
MSTAPHPVVPEEIMAYLDGELSAERAPSVATHIEACADCQEVRASLRNASESLSHWAVALAPANASFQDRVASLARENSLASNRSKARIFRFSSHWTRGQLIAGLAVALSVLFVFIVIPNSLRRPVAGRAMSATDRLRVKLAEKGQSALPLDEPLLTDQQRKVSSNRLPSANPTTLVAPNVTADANGLLQGPDDRVENSFSLDGQAISDQQSRVSRGPMISRTVSLSLFTKDFESSRASLEAILVRHKGYSAELNIATPQNAARSLETSLRIPAPELPAALAELKSLGRVEGETQNGEEVTQQHADLLARLKNSHETEQRLQAILTERTGKISDVLGVEREIARVRGEIEQMEAEQKNLEHRVDFATVNLALSEEYKAKLDSPAPAISTLIHNAAVNGYGNLAHALLAIVLFFVEYGPVLIFWLFLFSIPAGLVWRRWRHALAV